jgi:hypothetical protein
MATEEEQWRLIAKHVERSALSAVEWQDVPQGDYRRALELTASLATEAREARASAKAYCRAMGGDPERILAAWRAKVERARVALQTELERERRDDANADE